MVADVLRASGA